MSAASERMRIAIASAGAAWEAQLLRAFAEPGSPIEVVRRCLDVADLEATAPSVRAALVAADLPRLDAAAVSRTRQLGVELVAMVHRNDEVGEERMRGLGIDVVVPVDAAPEIISAVLVESHRGGPSTVLAASARGSCAEDGGGAVIAVWGPTGAPGRTTVALALADELSRIERDVLLVDADVYGGTIAAHVGLLDDNAGLVELCRQRSPVDPVALAARCAGLRPGLRCLTTSPLAARHTELRPAVVTEVLDAARRITDVCVVDLGFCLEIDGLPVDTLPGDRLQGVRARTGGRNATTLAVLAAADLVLVVGSADPIGLQRVVRGLAELASVVPGTEPVLVLNRVRRATAGSPGRREIEAVTRHFAGLDPLALLPYDRQWLDAAVSRGRTLAEVRRSSPLRRQVAILAEVLSGRIEPAEAPRRHRRRR